MKEGSVGFIKSRLAEEDADLAREIAAEAPQRKLALALRSLRKRAGLTQAEVARVSGLAQPHISRLESATGPSPSPETLRRFAQACNARMEMTFYEDDGASSRPRVLAVA